MGRNLLALRGVSGYELRQKAERIIATLRGPMSDEERQTTNRDLAHIEEELAVRAYGCNHDPKVIQVRKVASIYICVRCGKSVEDVGKALAEMISSRKVARPSHPLSGNKGFRRNTVRRLV